MEYYEIIKKNVGPDLDPVSTMAGSEDQLLKESARESMFIKQYPYIPV